tara:strand:+ start:280 stop:423 length:144 start_codon:yes stop_codon:yes gene_type:complete
MKLTRKQFAALVALVVAISALWGLDIAPEAIEQVGEAVGDFIGVFTD